MIENSAQGASSVYVERQDVAAWIKHAVTRRVFELLLQRFDHQTALMGAEPGTSIDRFRGRAEVLAYLKEPKAIIDLMPLLGEVGDAV